MRSTPIDLSLLVVIWMLLALATVFIRIYRGQREIGLVWAYLASLWLLHWPGAFIYMLPWYASTQDAQYSTVYLGFVQSTVGILGFLVGAAFLAPPLVSILEAPRSGDRSAPPDAGLPRSYLVIGTVLYAVIMPVASRVPTLTALASAGTQLVVVGICLRCWHGWHTRNNRMFYGALFIAALIPVATIMGQGFLGYGAGAVITVLCFNGSYIRPRWKVGVAALFVAYFGFSAYVTYMRDRSEIRNSVWGGESFANRLATVVNAVENAEMFNPQNTQHLDRIDMRLNQNFLVGASVEKISSRAVDHARGETLRDAFAALVPRVLWPDKPIYAGSPGVVTKYTSINFEAGTSVGVGQVMEFYINFGIIGVLVGFILLGAVVGLFDAFAAQRLWVGDWRQFAAWFLAGLGFIQAGGSLIEVFSTVGAGLASATLVNRYVLPWMQGTGIRPMRVATNFPSPRH